MIIQAVILLVLGIFFLFIGWLSQNANEKETITYLKGLALLKKEVKDLRKDLNVLNDKVDKSLGFLIDIQEKSNWEEETSLESGSGLSQEDSPTEQNNNPAKDIELELSEKYREVILLASQGFNTAQIADRLSISQDAVEMVLRTYRGKNKR